MANTTTAEAHFDIIEEIRSRVKLSPVTWSFRHVYGHQDGTDGHCYYGPFHRWDTLNIQMDSLAKAHLHLERERCDMDPTSVVQSVSSKQWELWISNQKTTKRIEAELYDDIYCVKIQHKYTTDGYISAIALPLVSWEASGKAMTNSSEAK